MFIKMMLAQIPQDVDSYIKSVVQKGPPPKETWGLLAFLALVITIYVGLSHWPPRPDRK
jgi:hypothetical protein